MKRDILYVDDESSNLIVFEAAFEDDYNVHLARNAGEALAFLEKKPVPVVISDQRMPEMTGVEMFSILRKQHPHAQRVILSGFADSDAIIDAINKGQVFQFVRKPWQRVDLLSVLQRALDAHDLSMQNSLLLERLLVSQQLAMLGQVTGRVAHEMSNQLNLLPLIEYLEDEYARDDQLMQFSGMARQMYERMTHLIGEIKTFLRFESPEMPRKNFSLGDSVRELVSFLRFSGRLPVERLTVEYQDEPVVAGHRLKIHQVLVNLVQNAADAIAGRDDGRIDLVVKQDGSEAVVSVRDNGCGIDEDILEKMWEPFFTTKGDRGNGLGLDIARQLVESHGGTITCQSSHRSGSCFEVRLPVVELDAESSAKDA